MITLKEKFNEKRQLVEVETDTYIVEVTHYGDEKPMVIASHKSNNWNDEFATPVMSIEDDVMRVRTSMMGELSSERLKLLREQLEESEKLCLYLNAYLNSLK